MAKIVRRPRPRSESLRRHPRAAILPGRRRQQAGDDAQQGRLARSVRPGDDQRVALAERKVDAGKDRLAAALAAQIIGDQPHRPPRFHPISAPTPRSLCNAANMAIPSSRTIPGNSLYPAYQPASGRRRQPLLRRTSVAAVFHGSDAWERTAEMAVPAPLRVIACHRRPFPLGRTDQDGIARVQITRQLQLPPHPQRRGARNTSITASSRPRRTA